MTVDLIQALLLAFAVVVILMPAWIRFLRFIGIESDAVAPFRFIPDFPDLPMEEVYQREAPDKPAVVCTKNAAGGRTVYFPFNLGGLTSRPIHEVQGT